MHEVVLQIVLIREHADAVILAGNEEHIEMLIRLDQRVDHL